MDGQFFYGRGETSPRTDRRNILENPAERHHSRSIDLLSDCGMEIYRRESILGPTDPGLEKIVLIH